MSTTTHPTAERLRSQAETILRRIEQLRGPRRENTPKRAREGMSARCDANNLERVRRALLALAEGYDAGTVPTNLRHLTTRAHVERLVTKRLGTSGYYDVHETNEWTEDTDEARNLREFVAEIEGGAHAEADAERARRDQIAQLEKQVRFADIPGFFPTPPEIVAQMIREADFEPGATVLEPSAGMGSIAELARDAGAVVTCIERNHTLASICEAKGLTVCCEDFMELEPNGDGFDVVLMNPPFEQLADTKHVRHAWEFVKPGGILVAIMSASVKYNGRAEWFRKWAGEEVGGYEIEDLPPGSFSSGFVQTDVNACMVTIRKT